MTERGHVGLVVAAVTLALLAGCVPSRQEYYGNLRRIRTRAYRQWEAQGQGEDRPRISGPLELEGAVRLALRHSRQIQAALQDKEAARGRRMEAYSEALPTVDLTAGYTRLDQVMTIDLGVETFQVGDRDNYNYRLQITQPLFKGGTMLIAQRAARLFTYLSDESVRATVEEVLYRVATSYYDAVLAGHLVSVQQDALRSARAHLESVEAKRAQGVATEYDVLRARVDVSNIQADLIEQQNRRDLAIARLFKAMGVSQQSDVELTTPLRYAPQEVSFSEAVRSAFLNRPDIYSASIQRDFQQEALNEARTKYWPRLEAYYWHLWAKPDPHEATNITWDRQWQAGINLVWHLFDGFAREGRIIQRKADVRRREILLAETEEQALEQVKSAILELQNAAELVESQKLNRERARRALSLVEEGYSVGVNTELEVLDAQAALTRAQGLYYNALYRHTLARINLQKAMGLIAPPPGSTELPKEPVSPGEPGTVLGEP